MEIAAEKNSAAAPWRAWSTMNNFFEKQFFLMLFISYIALFGLAANADDEAGSVSRAIHPSHIGIDPTLPNVLIIGDSISLHYTPFVVAELAGKANVFHSGGKWGCNASSTTVSLKKQKASGKHAIELWLDFQANTHFCGKKAPGAPKPRDYDLSKMNLKWDVVVANWGLWDVSRYGGPDSKIATSLEQYRENMETLFRCMAATEAPLIWASTTPVPPMNLRNRRDEDVVAFNAVAAAVAKKHEAEICDLYSLVKPKITPEWRKKNDPNEVHFSKELGSPFLGKQVAAAVLAALDEEESSTVERQEDNACDERSLQSQLPKHEQQTEDGFVSLFNGKDLSGWHITKEAPFNVKDGIIHLEGGSGSLLSDQKFRDFELRLDFRFVNGSGDSGVFVRVEDNQKYQIRTNSAFGPRGMGSIRAGKKEEIKTTYDESVIPKIRRGKSEWYSYSIVVQGQRAAVSVNGIPTATAEGLIDRAGSVGFQAERSPLQFKNIRIKELKREVDQ